MIKGSLNMSRDVLNLDIPEVGFAPGLSVFRSALTAATASTYTLYDLFFLFFFLTLHLPSFSDDLLYTVELYI